MRWEFQTTAYDIWCPIQSTGIASIFVEKHTMESADENPYAPPVMQSDRPFRRKVAFRDVWLRRLMILQSLVIVVALVAERYAIESIVGSGPIFALIGLLIFGIGLRTHNHPATWYGISAVAFALLIVFPDQR